MATTVATWPARYQVENKPQASAFEPLKELLRMLARGCFHRHKSRPFTTGRMTYRVCTDCRARRRFDLDRWESYGPYFFAEEIHNHVKGIDGRQSIPTKNNIRQIRAA